MQKKIIVAGILIIFAAFFLINKNPQEKYSETARAVYSGYYGNWSTVKAGYNILEGKVTAVELKANTENDISLPVLFYDKGKRGLICMRMLRHNFDYCMITSVKQTNIKSGDNAEDVVGKRISGTQNFFASFEENADTLQIKGMIGESVKEKADCMAYRKCNYNTLLTILKRN